VSKSIQFLVEEFAKHIQGQQEAMRRGDVAAGNRHADKYFAAWHALRDEHGDAGRDGLAVLFQHPNQEVKLMAATLLLRHKTVEATRILEEAATAGDYGAELTLERWRNGAWTFDPAPAPGTEE